MSAAVGDIGVEGRPPLQATVTARMTSVAPKRGVRIAGFYIVSRDSRPTRVAFLELNGQKTTYGLAVRELDYLCGRLDHSQEGVMGRRERFVCCVSALILFTSAATAFAQSQLVLTYVDTSYTGTPFQPNLVLYAKVVGVNIPDQTIAWAVTYAASNAADLMPSTPVAVTSDGSRAMWVVENSSGSFLQTRDLASGSMTSPIPITSPLKLIAHPRRAAIFAVTRTGVDVIEGNSRQSVAVCSGVNDAAVTPDGSQLFVACADRVEVRSSGDLSFVRSLSIAGARVIEVNADATRLAVGDELATTLYDAQSGVLIASANAPIQSGLNSTVRPSILKATPDRRRLLQGYVQVSVSPTSKSGQVALLEFGNLAPVAQAPFFLDDIAFSPDGRTAYGVANPQPAGTRQIAVIDLMTGSVAWAGAGLLAGLYPQRTGLALSSVPLAPLQNAPIVEGRNVTFSWTLPTPSPMVTRYLIDVRLAPGGPVIVTLYLGTLTSQTVGNVPVGNYFVSIRAENYRGSSESSALQQLTVR